MSRLSEIIENHRNLDDLCSLLKHYSVNAQFVAESIIEKFNQIAGEEKDNDEESKPGMEENNNQYSPDLLDDLKQYYARL